MPGGKGAGEGGGGGPSRWTGPNKNANYGEVGSVALINRLITGIVPNNSRFLTNSCGLVCGLVFVALFVALFARKTHVPDKPVSECGLVCGLVFPPCTALLPPPTCPVLLQVRGRAPLQLPAGCPVPALALRALARGGARRCTKTARGGAPRIGPTRTFRFPSSSTHPPRAPTAPLKNFHSQLLL